MKKTVCLWGLAAAILAACTANLCAETFPLHFKKLDARTAFYSPEGYCTVVILSDKKPAELKKEPETLSKKLYARLFSSERPVVLRDNFPTPPTIASWGQPVTIMRLTEKEVGEGYDTAIIDLNNNGDLTDDPVFRDNKVAKYRKFFGPFILNLPEGTLPADSIIQPVMYLESGFLSAPRSYMDPQTGKFTDFFGFAAVRNGWALEGNLDINKVLQHIAFKDAYCDFTFSQNVSHREVLNDDLYFDNAKKASSLEFFPSDYVLRDYNNNGVYDCELPLNESEPYGKYLPLNDKLYTWEIAADLRSCTVTPVDKDFPTGTYTVERTTDKRTQVALMTGYKAPASQTGTTYGDGKWQLITLDGKVRSTQLPAGSYVLSEFALRSKDADNLIAHFPLDSFAPRSSTSFQIEAGKEFTAPWGEPLKLTLDAYHPNDTTQGDTLQIYINLVGKNGETYSDFSIFNPKTRLISPLNGPRVEIFCDDKPIGSHQFTHDFLAWWWKIPAELKGKKILLVPIYEECPVHPVTLEVQL
ncbi:MAG: hypothetical protein IJU47_03410 [Verrucomicrobia bacterium]|nr:hypothetical protein [Verrucomicrobiota bacterium]